MDGNEFFNFMDVSKAQTLFSQSNEPFTEELFRAHVAILRGLLLTRVESAASGNLDGRRITTFLTQLDILIARSFSLPKTSSLPIVQKIAKSTLYQGISSYLVLAQIHGTARQPSSDYSVLAACAYRLAFETLVEGGCDNVSGLACLACIEAYLITREYLAHATSDSFESAMCDNTLHLRLHSVLGANTSGDRLQSFLLSTTPVTHDASLPPFDLKEALGTLWSARRHTFFFRRLLWSLSMLSASDWQSYGFVDEWPLPLASLPKNLDDDYKAESFTRFDLKILLFRLAVNARESSHLDNPSADVMRNSWILSPESGSYRNLVWKALNLLCDKGVSSGPVALIYLGNALQEVRLCTVPTCDKTGLAQTAKFLWHMSDKSGDRHEQVLYSDLGERYATSFLESTHGSTWRAAAQSTLFPPVTDLSDEQEEERIHAELETRRTKRQEAVKSEVEIEILETEEPVATTIVDDDFVLVSDRSDDVRIAVTASSANTSASEDFLRTTVVHPTVREELVVSRLRRGRILHAASPLTAFDRILVDGAQRCRQASRQAPSHTTAADTPRADKIDELRENYEKELSRISELAINERVRSLEKFNEISTTMLASALERHKKICKFLNEHLRKKTSRINTA